MPAIGASGNVVRWRVASLAERNALTVGQDEVGFLCHVLAGDGGLYPALRAGSGSDCWTDSALGSAGAGISAYQRVFSFDDTDVDVADTSVGIDFGDALPSGAIVLAVIAEVTTEFTNGAEGVFTADVGESGGDDDLFTPTPINIQLVGPHTQSVAIPASDTQLAVSITGDANLSTLTAGEFTLTVLYCEPALTLIEAP